MNTEPEYDLEWFSGTGPGGQHRNKHANCCRIHHRPTGLSAQSTRHRSRHANFRDAAKLLQARISAHATQQTERYRASDDRVRTYHAERNVAIDHASGTVTPYRDLIEKGNVVDLQRHIEARKRSIMIDRT